MFIFICFSCQDYPQIENPGSFRRIAPSHCNLMSNKRQTGEKASAGTNTRSAPRRHAPGRPCCSLCSARARSGLRARQLPGAFRWEIGLVAPLLPAAPLFPRLRNRSVSRRQLPTEAAGNEERRFHSETVGASMKLRKPVRLTHQSKCNRADRTSDIFQAQSTDLTWAYTAWPSRGLRAREVRQAIIWPSRKGQGYYGSAQT